jgi:hypothetical protein
MSARALHSARVVHINTQRAQGFAAAGDMEVTCRCWKGQQGRHPCTTPDACELPEPTGLGPLRRFQHGLGLWAAVLGVPAFVISLALATALWSPAA